MVLIKTLSRRTKTTKVPSNLKKKNLFLAEQYIHTISKTNGTEDLVRKSTVLSLTSFLPNPRAPAPLFSLCAGVLLLSYSFFTIFIGPGEGAERNPCASSPS